MPGSGLLMVAAPATLARRRAGCHPGTLTLPARRPGYGAVRWSG
ncbi:MAG TPA: hypothetical protein VEF71_07630 [Streptosporangiaceae bacterium]|nr:hypothetical protein [Streptosporangiaceae bacterium]